MVRLARALAALLLAALAVPAAAQGATEPLAWLAGNWRGSGTMFGNASEAALDVAPVLGGRFLELRYRAGPFEGRAFYSPSQSGRWQATWFDNRGISFSIDAGVDARTLTSDWGTAEIERGRTVYRLLDDGRLEVVETVMTRDGQSREFARHTFSRANPTE